MGSSVSQPVSNCQLYFCPECDIPGSSAMLISDSELMEKMEQLVDSSEVIHRVYLYRTPLYWFQLTELVMYHVFIVLQTDNWWWSIEKNQDNITLQRARKASSVVDEYRGRKREVPVSLVVAVQGKRHVRDLIGFLGAKDYLNRPYNLLWDNCKSLAINLLNYLNSGGKRYTFDAIGHCVTEVTA